MIPEEVGIACNDCSRQDARAKPEELQYKHGKNAAENEIDISEKREVETIARQAGSYQGKKEKETGFTGYCGV
jgi:hypothetical protein